MIETKVTKETMDALEVLAQTNLKIAEAKTLIYQLQEEETAYLEIREQKALTRITNLMNESAQLLSNTKKNYEEVHILAKTATAFAEYLSEAHHSFRDMLSNFDDRNAQWDKKIRRAEETVASFRKEVENDHKEVEQKNKELTEKFIKLQEEKQQIESRQQALTAAYAVEKELWNKLNSK